jgi:hypothetical protein
MTLAFVRPSFDPAQPLCCTFHHAKDKRIQDGWPSLKIHHLHICSTFFGLKVDRTASKSMAPRKALEKEMMSRQGRFPKDANRLTNRFTLCKTTLPLSDDWRLLESDLALTPFLFPRLDSKLKMMIRIALLFRHLR